MNDAGCCFSCKGLGAGGPASGPETNGRCADCRGEGCSHDGQCEPVCVCTMVRPMQREFGSGVPIAPAEWEQAEDCPVHPMQLHCEECGTQAVVIETSGETSGAMEAERQWLFTRLACGHNIETALR